MYAENEVDISKSNLLTVISSVKEPVCLLGGWAVYITVNQNFRVEQSRNYMGSRDIDLGFHIDDTWSDEQLQKSTFVKSMEILKNMKYYEVGSRFVQHHVLETKKPLTETESKKYPRYAMFDLFVDPIVDKIHPRSKSLFGWCPIDEPLLANVFSENQYTMSKYFKKEIMIPCPEVLISMKIKSVLNRNKEDKRIKDMVDLYSLILYSNSEFSDLKRGVQKICGAKKVSLTVSKFTNQDYNMVSQIINIDANKISKGITEIAKN